MKKIKPMYIYLFGIVIAVAAIILVSKDNPQLANNTVQNAPPSGDIEGKTMPNDQVHQGLENPLAQKPGKNNVMPSIMQHMEKLKSDVEKHPDDTLKIRQYADFLNEAHQYDKAIVYYKKILEKNPKRIDVLSSLVFISFNQNKLNESEKYLKRILSIDKNNVEAMYNLGAVSATKGERKKAREIWTKIVDDYPNSPLAQKAKDSINRL